MNIAIKKTNMCGGFKIKESSSNEKHARLLLEFIRANPDKDFFELLEIYLNNNKLEVLQNATIQNKQITN